MAWTAANIDKRWIGMNVQTHLQARLQRPVAFLNDADAAGIAEMTMGAGRHRHAGHGHGADAGHRHRHGAVRRRQARCPTPNSATSRSGQEAEHRASAKVRTDRQLDWVEWAAEVNVVLAAYHALLWPDVFIVGGGVTENWQHFGSLLSSRAEIVRAAFGNDAGIIGAAMAASQLGRALTVAVLATTISRCRTSGAPVPDRVGQTRRKYVPGGSHSPSMARDGPPNPSRNGRTAAGCIRFA